MAQLSTSRRQRRRAIVALAILAPILLPLLILALLPAAPFRGIAEHVLSRAIGAPVTIARMERLDRFSLVPRIAIAGMRVGGDRTHGPQARLDEVTLRLPLVPLLLRGAIHPHALWVTGGRVRVDVDAEGRSNWPVHGRGDPTGAWPRLASLGVRDLTLDVHDARRGMAATIRVAADARGLRLDGAGSHRGTPLALHLAGGPLVGVPDGAYPFAVQLTSPLLSLRLNGVMDHPLDIAHWRASVVARATDARRLDDVLEVGLPGTQPIALAGRVERSGGRWLLVAPHAALGRSRFASWLMVTHANGRTRLDAKVDAERFDLDDLASDEDLAKRAADNARTGPRLIPGTPIRLDKLQTLDGRLVFRTPVLLVRGAPMFRSLATTLVLDHRQLTLAPLQVGLAHGRVTGSAHVDHREGEPKLRLDLLVHDEQISDFFGGQDHFTGPLQARVRLAGTGVTVRAALGNANGRLGIVSERGSLERKLAVLAGGDVLKGLGAAIGGDGDRRVPVACLIADFRAANGVLTPRPLVIDTPVSRLDGSGSISLATEREDLRLTGRAKHEAAIRVTPVIRIGGTLSNPSLVAGVDGKDGGFGHGIGRILGALKLGGGTDATAPPVDCASLAAAALR